MINLNVEENGTGKTFDVKLTRQRDGSVDIYVNEWAVMKLSEKKDKFTVEIYDSIEDTDFLLNKDGSVMVKNADQ